MAGIVSGILLGVCLAGLAIALYMQLVGYDPVTQSRGMRTAIVISADFLGILCLLAGQLIAVHFHWGGARAQTRLDVWVAIASADRKSTRMNSSHLGISYAVFCLKKNTQE